ncbi:MAG: hypothetical protein FWD58_07890 [Firmicutes bacterium]|nr:hypothetical protein [Bacillota bacterium]
MPLDDTDKRTCINELQFLQRQINLLSKVNNPNPEPSISRTVEIMQTSQNKLYGALVKNGVTAEEMHKIIMENNDKQLVKSIISLQKSKSALETKLANPDISPQKRQSFQKSLSEKEEKYAGKWNEIINSPNKDELITKIELAQSKNQQKSRTPNKTPGRTR